MSRSWQKKRKRKIFSGIVLYVRPFLGGIYRFCCLFHFFDGSVLRSRRRRNRKSATRPDMTQKDIRDYYGGPFVDGDDVPRQHQTLITKKRCLADDDYGGDILV